MTDLELKQQDELVNAMIAHYQAIIDRYKKSIEDVIAEIEQIVKEEKPEDSSWACGLKYSIGIIRNHMGVNE